MPPRKLKPWTDLAPHRGGVALSGTPLLGHLWHWRAGAGAPDLEVPGASGPDAVDWAGFPDAAPKGYEQLPAGKRRSGMSASKTQAQRVSKIVGVTLSDEARAALERQSVAHGGNKSATVEALIMAAEKKK